MNHIFPCLILKYLYGSPKKHDVIFLDAFQKPASLGFLFPRFSFKQNIQLWIRNCQVINFNDTSPLFIKLDYNGRDIINIWLLLIQVLLPRIKEHISVESMMKKSKPLVTSFNYYDTHIFGSLVFWFSPLPQIRLLIANVDSWMTYCNTLRFSKEFFNSKNSANHISLCTLLPC